MRSLVFSLLVTLTAAPLASAQSLGIEVTKPVDCVRKTQNGDKISVNYRGTLKSDGSEFDSSYRRNTPFKFSLGKGQVIAGWDQGLLDMCIGEGRKLTIPPNLGYGQSRSGPIPPGSTLIFETELVAIDGVKLETLPSKPTSAPSSESTEASEEAGEVSTSSPTASPTPSLLPAIVEPATSATAAEAARPTATQISPMEDQDNAECHLLGPYALIVQGALGLLAVSSLVFKRWRESPRRPLKIWFFDVSKQVFGSVLLHLANIMMSMLSSGSFDVAAQTKATTSLAGADADGKTPNPCSFYLLNLAIDTTIGIPILVLLLKILHRAFSLTPIANPPESIRSGNYGQPPHATWWLKQSVIYFLGLFGMKLCVFAIFQLLPWIAWVGDWALRWTEGSEALQILFVMFVFPLIMNAIQYWIIDGFIKDKSGSSEGGARYEGVASDDGEESDDDWLERRRRSGERDSGDEADDVLKEANPTAVPVRSNSGKGRQYDPHVDGQSSSN